MPRRSVRQRTEIGTKRAKAWTPVGPAPDEGQSLWAVLHLARAIGLRSPSSPRSRPKSSSRTSRRRSSAALPPTHRLFRSSSKGGVTLAGTAQSAGATRGAGARAPAGASRLIAAQPSPSASPSPRLIGLALHAEGAGCARGFLRPANTPWLCGITRRPPLRWTLRRLLRFSVALPMTLNAASQASSALRGLALGWQRSVWNSYPLLEPVPPQTKTTWCSVIARAISSRRAETGSALGKVIGEGVFAPAHAGTRWR
jgi:hypothetical protein